MSRCKKKRCCRELGDNKLFKPRGIPSKDLDVTEVELDEFEAMRLCDIEGISQIEAAKVMDISRGTVQRLLQKGRKKLMEALLYEKGLLIRGSIKEEQ